MAKKTTAKSTAKKTTRKASPEKVAASAQQEVEKRVETETEQGFRGTEVDQTPNENYTVEGVIRNKPVPETNEEARAAARKQ
jgi:hypothetical protein